MTELKQWLMPPEPRLEPGFLLPNIPSSLQTAQKLSTINSKNCPVSIKETCSGLCRKSEWVIRHIQMSTCGVHAVYVWLLASLTSFINGLINGKNSFQNTYKASHSTRSITPSAVPCCVSVSVQSSANLQIFPLFFLLLKPSHFSRQTALGVNSC